MGTQTVEAPERISADRGRALALILLGGLLGLAWAAGMRGFMAQIVGDESSVSWSGTFGFILLPGVLTGLLLGWAEHLRRKGERRRAWLALSPLLFMAVLLRDGPQGVLGIFEDGLGGGAIGVPLYAMAGGYAISGRGPRWGRLVCGALALTAIPVWALTVESFGGSDLAVTTARGLWVALYYYSFLAIIMIAAAIPHRPAIDA
jgi:MFS family permease